MRRDVARPVFDAGRIRWIVARTWHHQQFVNYNYRKLFSYNRLAKADLPMALRGFRPPFTASENILGFPRPPAPGPGTQALDLVYQAADMFRSIEDRARASEARAEAAEQAQLEIINATERKLRDAARALEEARRRIESQQEQLETLEFRAQVAEAEAREARQSLALVEDAIRRRLLLTADQLDNSGSAVA